MVFVVTRELSVVFDVEFGDTCCVFVIDCFVCWELYNLFVCS